MCKRKSNEKRKSISNYSRFIEKKNIFNFPASCESERSQPVTMLESF